jgi:hypothetical protein
VSSTASGSASGSSSSAGAGATPIDARRLSVRNQTVNVSPLARQVSRPNWAISARVRTVYPARTIVRVGTPGIATSSSHTKNANPTTAGQILSTSGSGEGAQPCTPMRRSAHAPMSWRVANGSSHSQIGKTSAEIRATPTQP